MDDDSVLIHYGTPRHSGRYPWGSGKDPQQDHRSFLGMVDELKKQGVSDPDIAAGLGLKSTTELRAKRSIALNALRAEHAAQALRLKETGMSTSAIGREMNISESSVRALLDPSISDRQNILHETANMLKSTVDKGKFVDVGSGTENLLGISETKLRTAVAILQEQGYEVHKVQEDQLGTRTGQKTTIKVVAPPGTSYRDVARNKENIVLPEAYTTDNGRNWEPIVPPRSISPDRVSVRFAEQGGSNADGVIYVRPGVDDVSLGSSRYAQVRIKVGDGHYLKGMAMYKDGLPEGTDLLFNTNKSSSVGKMGAMKPLSSDVEERPFGAVTRQQHYTDSNGKKQLSVMNIVNEEGDWQRWSKTLSSQFLSKQSPQLARRQLDLAYQKKLSEFNEISKLTNPTVKKKLLELFADGAESASVHLKAYALPSQKTHVILPFEKMKVGEIYAPNYDNGTRVALVRFPHAGTFEIPELVVNNKYPEARKTIGGAKGSPAPIDAVGVHPEVAKRLSGADFDGDTVLVIPNNSGEVKSRPALEGLKNFDPQSAYPYYEGMQVISARVKQQQMGNVSNLITDMTIKGASDEELAAAVRHSMVIIDAEKHKLNYKQSEEDNGIINLKRKYQGVGPTGRLHGASTLISRSGNATVPVPLKRLRKVSEPVIDPRTGENVIDPVTGKKVYVRTPGPIDPVTGEKVYVNTGETRVKRTVIDLNTKKRVALRRGVEYDPSTLREKVVLKTMNSRPILEVKDAHELVSEGGGTPIEKIYADHSNRLRALANEARKEMINTKGQIYTPSAAKTYSAEVKQLAAELDLAKKNRPRERQAQLLGAAMYRAVIESNPHLDDADKRKERGRALKRARDRVGASKPLVQIDEAKWRAIQAGAISDNRLSEILDNADLDKVKELATPRTSITMTPDKLAKARQLLNNGYSQADVASVLGVPASTLNSALVRSGADGV